MLKTKGHFQKLTIKTTPGMVTFKTFNVSTLIKVNWGCNK